MLRKIFTTESPAASLLSRSFATKRKVATPPTKAQVYARRVLGIRNTDALGQPIPPPASLSPLRFDHQISHIPIVQKIVEESKEQAKTAESQLQEVIQAANQLLTPPPTEISSETEKSSETQTAQENLSDVSIPLSSYDLPPGDSFAVVDVFGNQFKVFKNDVIMTGLQKNLEVGQKIVLTNVLLVGARDFTLVGRPTIPEAEVHATVEEHTQTGKLHVFKKKRRKGYKRYRTHRDDITVLRIDDVIYPELQTTAKVELPALYHAAAGTPLPSQPREHTKDEREAEMEREMEYKMKMMDLAMKDALDLSGKANPLAKLTPKKLRQLELRREVPK